MIAYFVSRTVGDVDEDGVAKKGSLWTVQVWGEGGLARLNDYPWKKQEYKEGTAFWPPIQRVRDTGLGPRKRYLRNAVKGVLAAVAAVHTRGVSHNAIDGGAPPGPTRRPLTHSPHPPPCPVTASP